MEKQYRIRTFLTTTNKEIGRPTVSTDRRYALVVACDGNSDTYRTLEVRECPEWEAVRVPSREEVRAMIDSGELQ